MNKGHLVINEPPLMVLPGLAKAIGLNEAIILQQLHWWTSKETNVRDGRSWVYNTYDDWVQQFPFWSKITIRRAIGNLENNGLVISTSKYNKMHIDNTKWYAVDYEALERVSRPCDQNEQTTCSKRAERSDQIDHANNHRLPETTTENKEYMHIEDLEQIRITKEEYGKLLEFMKAEEIVKDYLYKFAAWIITQTPAKQKKASAYLSVRNWYKRDSEGEQRGRNGTGNRGHSASGNSSSEFDFLREQERRDREKLRVSEVQGPDGLF